MACVTVSMELYGIVGTMRLREGVEEGQLKGVVSVASRGRSMEGGRRRAAAGGGFYIMGEGGR